MARLSSEPMVSLLPKARQLGFHFHELLFLANDLIDRHHYFEE